jgi:hypothetical protein
VIDVICPHCHAPALSAAKKPYCSVCGWNIDVAEQAALRNFRNLPLGLVFLAIFFVVAFVISRRGESGAISWIVFCAIAFVVVAANVVRDWTALGRLRHARGFVNRHFGTISAPVGVSWDERTLREHAYILSLPKPRSVRMSRIGRTTVLVFSAVCLAFLLVAILGILPRLLSGGLRTGKDTSDLLFVAFAFIFSALASLGLWRDFRTRQLFINGEVTLGRVTSQSWTGGKHRRSDISYEYQDRSGKLYVGSGADKDRTLFESMPLAVFYDPDNPNEQVASCSGLWEVVPPAIGSHSGRPTHQVW